MKTRMSWDALIPFINKSLGLRSIFSKQLSNSNKKRDQARVAVTVDDGIKTTSLQWVALILKWRLTLKNDCYDTVVCMGWMQTQKIALRNGRGASLLKELQSELTNNPSLINRWDREQQIKMIYLDKCCQVWIQSRIGRETGSDVVGFVS